LQHAKELWALASDGLDHLRRTARESMPGAHTVSGHLAVARTRDGRLRARANTLRDEFGADVEFWPAARLRNALPTSPYFQALHCPNAFHLNALAYAHGLAAAAEQAGARIFEDTSAHRIDAEGVRKRVDTKSARVRASQIVLTDGAQAGRLFPRVSDTVLSLDAFAAVTAPLGEGLRSAMAFQGSVCEVDGDAAFHTLDGERLLWSGRTTTRAGDPQRMSARLRGDIARTFPQLGPVEIAHAWSARAGYAVHRMPQLGELKSGLWLANAFGRQGLVTSTTAGLLIAGAIAEGDDRWRLFSSYGLSWNGGAAARALVEAALQTRRMRIRTSDFLARYRPAPKVEAELPAHTDAPPFVPPDEVPVASPLPQQEPEPVMEEAVAAPLAATPMPKPARPKRARKAAPKAESRRKAKAAPTPGDVIVVRKTAKRRTKPKAITPVTAEPAPPAVAADTPDGGST
jgi:glycine/D-amino acid oxidase-like deaminating enzyme